MSASASTKSKHITVFNKKPIPLEPEPEVDEIKEYIDKYGWFPGIEDIIIKMKYRFNKNKNKQTNNNNNNK
jgi:hypothetical protein